MVGIQRKEINCLSIYIISYPGFQRIFFLIDNEAALKQKKAARRKKNHYFFLLGALRLVNAASPRTISVHKKKISSGTQGNYFFIVISPVLIDSELFALLVRQITKLIIFLLYCCCYFYRVL